MGFLLVIGSSIAAVVLLGIFFILEPRLRQLLIDLGLFANRGYVGANGVAFTQNFGFAALLFFLTLYLQNILGYSPLQAGLVFLTFSAILAIVDSFAGRLAASVGSHLPMAAGMALCAVAFLQLFLLSPTSGLTIVILALLVAGVGQALAYTVSTTGGMQAIPEAKAGAASVAASGANLDSSDRAEIRGLLSGSEAAQEKLARIAPGVARQIEEVVRKAFVYAFDGAMLLCMAMTVAGVLAAFLVASKTSHPQRTAGSTSGTGKPRRLDR
jgi:hypothetical protein